MTTSPEFEGLRALCAEMESKAQEFGGLPHSAEQNDWGIEPREIEDLPGQFELRDCDGERWAVGTADQILTRRCNLLHKVEEAIPFSEEDC